MLELLRFFTFWAQTTAILPCDELVSSVMMKAPIGVTYQRAERVELRRCATPGIGTLQLVGWDVNKMRPSFIIDTTDLGIVQFAKIHNIVLVETAGGPRDRVYIVSRVNNHLEVVASRITKDVARINSDDHGIVITIPKISGNGEDTFRFP